MVTVSRSHSSRLSAGYYVATNVASGLQVGYDWFAVREVDDGLVVESQHTTFGSASLVQVAQFALDADWTPRRLEVKTNQGHSAVVEFAEDATVMSIHGLKNSQQMCFPIGRRYAYFPLSGGLYFPLHIVRRFRFEGLRPQQFNVIPEGLCEVRRLDDFIEDSQTFRLLEMKLSVLGIEDVVHLVINEREDLVRYHTRNLNLLVELEEEKSSC